jgi:hypothetical protein
VLWADRSLIGKSVCSIPQEYTIMLLCSEKERIEFVLCTCQNASGAHLGHVFDKADLTAVSLLDKTLNATPRRQIIRIM